MEDWLNGRDFGQSLISFQLAAVAWADMNDTIAYVQYLNRLYEKTRSQLLHDGCRGTCCVRSAGLLYETQYLNRFMGRMCNGEHFSSGFCIWYGYGVVSD